MQSVYKGNGTKQRPGNSVRLLGKLNPGERGKEKTHCLSPTTTQFGGVFHDCCKVFETELLLEVCYVSWKYEC